MHCWKTINIKREYGSTWLYIMSVLLFLIIFTLSFVIFGRVHPVYYRDNFFWLFLLCLLVLYPLHKLIHYFSLLEYRKSVKLRLRIDYNFIPIIRMRITKTIPKNRYIFTLLAPFVLINSLLIYSAFTLPYYSHYICLLLSYHCCICLIDLLCVKILIPAPKNAVIEETPKGYEILVPPGS